MTKTAQKVWIWTSVFFALFASMGTLMHAGAGWFFLRWLLMIAVFGIVLAAGFIAWRYVQNFLARKHIRNPLFHKLEVQGDSRKLLRNLTILLVVLWIPAFLAFYPGTFGADAPVQLAMFNGNLTMTNHHPLLHTLVMGLLVRFGSLFGSPNFGLALYVFLCQILFCAYAIARSLVYLYKKGMNTWYLYAAAVLLAISPFNQALVCYTTKDIPFASALLLFVISVCELLFPACGFQESASAPGVISKTMQQGLEHLKKNINSSPGATKAQTTQAAASQIQSESDPKSHRFAKEGDWELYKSPAAVLGWGLLMSLLRNQGIYMIAVGIIILIILARLFHPRRRFSFFIGLQVILLVLAWVFTSAVPKMTGTAISNPREALALPIYQIASAITENEEADRKFLSAHTLDEALAYFDQFSPESMNEELDSADYPKSIFLNDKFSQNPAAFFWLYTKVVFSSPGRALQAAAHLMAPYFDMRLSRYNGLTTITSYENYSRQTGVTPASLLPGYQGYLKGLIAASSTTHCPFWLRLFDPAVVLYLLIFMLGLALFYKNGLLWMATLYSVLYVLTMLLGPVALLRYSFVYDIQAPFLTGILFLFLHAQHQTHRKARRQKKAVKKSQPAVQKQQAGIA